MSVEAGNPDETGVLVDPLVVQLLPYAEEDGDGAAAQAAPAFARRLKRGLAQSAAANFDVFLKLPIRARSFFSQFRYVWQWKLWSAEALDVFFLDKVISPSDPWPWWLRYNPLWLAAHYMLVLCFSSGCLLHCLFYQGYPVPDESVEERRFRIHYVYGFDAYLGLCVVLFTAGIFFLKDDKSHVALEGVVLSLLWILGNSLALQAMYSKSSTGIRCYVAGQLAWTVVLTCMNIFDLVHNFSAVALYHCVVVLFFWVCGFVYLLPFGPGTALWGLYTDQRRLTIGWHRAAIALTVLVVIFSSLLVLYLAGDLLWYIISGTKGRMPPQE
mmetsp:Transcript_19778/g.54940  ORF Transcript_19778/g.54940 Transcript_19778/m.54940 type:complete len:327 (-) Transcript_19778:1040-2020(-)